jgi:hypothetical protein
MTGTTNEAPKKSGHFLTLLVDLSHDMFKAGGMHARMNLIEVLKGTAESVAIGAEASVIKAPNPDGTPGDVVGVFLIAPDIEGHGSQSLKAALKLVDELLATGDYAVKAI